MSTLATASYQGDDLSRNISYMGNNDFSVRMYDTSVSGWVSIRRRLRFSECRQ